MRQCRLDEVAFLPEPQPRGKPQVSELSQRTEVVGETLESEIGLHVLRSNSAQFTVDETFPWLLDLFSGSHLTLLLGSDVVLGLKSWPKIEVLLKNMPLAIGMRTGSQHRQIEKLVNDLERVHAVSIEYRCIDTPYAHIASSQLR